MSNEIFKNALTKYVKDFASGDSVRRLADKGFTVAEIRARLAFPLESKDIGQIVWQRYLDTGVILTEDPKEASREALTYEKKQDKYGKVSFIQVRKKVDTDGEYLPCDIGKMLYKDRQGVIDRLSALHENELDYVLGLPWPHATVWHKKDPRICRILEALSSLT